MFCNQSEERDNSITLKYPILYAQWLEDNGKKPSTRINDYMDGEFFQWVVLEYKNSESHKSEMCELIDLLTRKNMTHRNYIGYDMDIKHELYSSAMDKIFKYTIDGYDPTKGTAFVFFTTAINNAFKETLKDYYRTKKIAKRLLTVRQTDAVAYNYESSDINDFEEQIKKSLVYFEDDEVDEIKRIWNEFYTTIDGIYKMKRSKMLVDKNVPKFKRQWMVYDHVINIGEKGIIVEFYDLRTTNESNGTRPNELKQRMIVARQNGYQYFGVFSDQWEAGRDVILQKLTVMKEYVEFSHDKSTGRELQFDYIIPDDFSVDNIMEPIFWGLKENRDIRVVLNQDIQSYINWLDTEKNATRVYGWGRLKAIK